MGALALALFSAHVADAQNQPMHGDSSGMLVEGLVIENPWARESVTPTSTAYFVVRNETYQQDRLIDVSSDVAETVQLHESTMQDGVMKMREVEAVDIPAYGETALEPGGVHVMLIGLEAPLEEGQSFPLTLTFENVGAIEVVVMVEDIGHTGKSHDHSN
jgi:hypothetical protein